MFKAPITDECRVSDLAYRLVLKGIAHVPRGARGGGGGVRSCGGYGPLFPVWMLDMYLTSLHTHPQTQRYISRPRLRLYALLAGLMVWEGEEGEGEVNVCCGLDWKRVFGLHLWYCRSPTDRVTEPVAQFTKGFQVSYS